MFELLYLGLALLVVGSIMLVMALLGLTGTIPRGIFGIIAVVILGAGTVLITPTVVAAVESVSPIYIAIAILIGFVVMYIGRRNQAILIGAAIVTVMLLAVVFTPLVSLAPHDPSGISTQALWSAQFTKVDVGGASGFNVVLSPDAKSANVYGTRASFAKLATVAASMQVINLNSGSSTQAFGLTATYGQIGVVTDPSTGMSSPIVSQNAQGTYSISWSGEGAQVGSTYYDTVPAGGQTSATASIAMNEQAWSGAQVGTQYPVQLVVGKVSLPINFIPVG